MSNGLSMALCASAVTAVAMLQAGCATQPDASGQPSSRPAVERVGLTATTLNAGEVGHAFLVPREQVTDVIVQVSGVPDDVTAPVHLYATIHQGTCANLGQPQYRLTPRVLADGVHDSFLTVRNTVAAPLGTLHSGAHALVVRSAPADANMTLFCGDLQAS